MRGVIEFYRSNPTLLIVAVVMAIVVSILVTVGGSGSAIGGIFVVAVVGLGLGLFVAWRRNRYEEE